MQNNEDKSSSLKLNAEPSSIEQFLSQIARPSPFIAIALILPSGGEAMQGSVEQWVGKLTQDASKACYWDQACAIAPSFYPKTQITLKYPIQTKVKAGAESITILPYQPDFASLLKKSEADKIDFLKHLIRCLKGASEVWVSVKASEIRKYFSIIQAANALCFAAVQGKNSVLSCYEAIKAIRLSGCYQPVGLLDFAPESCNESEYAGYQIKNVAKNFLGIDLAPSGVVLSNSTYIPPKGQANLRMRISQVEKSSQDFLHCICEASLYKMPGLV